MLLLLPTSRRRPLPPPQGEAGMASRPLYTWKPVLFLERDISQAPLLARSSPQHVPITPAVTLNPAVVPPSHVPEPVSLWQGAGHKGTRNRFQGVIILPKHIAATPTLRCEAPDPCTPGLRVPRASGSLAFALRRVGQSSLGEASPPPRVCVCSKTAF